MSNVVANIFSDLRPVRRPARVLYAGTAFWLLDKLGARDRVNAVVMAYEGGLMDERAAL